MPATLNESDVAACIARQLRARGVERVFGLCGGHIMPLWMAIDAEEISIVDVRDERAAAHMAQAHAEVTGSLGVALVTSGPGVTNALTGIANADVSRAPVLALSGCPPRPQIGRGALQDLDHSALANSVTRYARRILEPHLVPQSLDEAIARALGEAGEPGPALIDLPVDVLRARLPEAMARHYSPIAAEPLHQTCPPPEAIARAVELLWQAKRPLVISGRGARGAAGPLRTLLERLDAAYLDTGESRGLIPDAHNCVVSAMRGTVMQEADLVMTVGRRLDFQLAYGSPAVFGADRFVRIADCASELRDNRRGDVELFGTPARILEALVTAAGNRSTRGDRSWIARMRAGHRERAARLSRSLEEAPDGGDGRMHPNRLLGTIRERFGAEAIYVVDGGDFLSFARLALSGWIVLDPGALGCIGVGVPYGIAASLAAPERPVIVATGDGAFGFNAIEIETAVRHRAPVLIVVANNEAWQIEVHDQAERYGKDVGTRLGPSDYAAMARALGMHGERVERAEDLTAALSRAAASRPALVDVLVTADAVSSDARSGLAKVPDLQAIDAWDEAERRWQQGYRREPAAPRQ
jgi:acetolactate synthase I/II/III large subunit